MTQRTRSCKERAAHSPTPIALLAYGASGFARSTSVLTGKQLTGAARSVFGPGRRSRRLSEYATTIVQGGRRCSQRAYDTARTYRAQVNGIRPLRLRGPACVLCRARLWELAPLRSRGPAPLDGPLSVNRTQSKSVGLFKDFRAHLKDMIEWNSSNINSLTYVSK
jgi:hypothetical protein